MPIWNFRCDRLVLKVESAALLEIYTDTALA